MSNDGGFTLVEVLAALAVFSLAAVGLIQVTAQSTRTAGALEQRYAARVVASNVLADALAQNRSLQRGSTAGTDEQLGRAFEWTREVSSASSGLLQVQVTVSAPETGQVLAELSALRAE